MRPLTPQGQNTIENLAQRYGVSTGAVMAMLKALIEGNGTMAQFSHPEFGGMGQWTKGGMTMVGDMFNHALKAKVDSLCLELADLLSQEPGLMRRSGHQSQSQSQGSHGRGDVSLFLSSGGGWRGDWWPAELGAPAATGSQNQVRYAFFPATRRLAIEVRGHLTVYDTEDHQITGVSQQQSRDAPLTFISQKGLVRVADLRVVSTAIGSNAPEETTPVAERAADAAARPTPTADAPPGDDIFFKIERLADLLKTGLLSEEEFAAKKSELLSRL
jgi:hypothetical protein